MALTPVLLLLVAQTASPAAVATGLPLTGAEAEEFLLHAEVTDVEYFDNTADTKPRRVVLTDGERTHRAVFKDVDTFGEWGNPTSGRSLHKLHDSYAHEIAAYELDKLLGLGIVPPCVTRVIEASPGSLCLWVEGGRTVRQLEKENSLNPPDEAAFRNRIHDTKLFLQLARDGEYHSDSNILIDGAWNVYKIDSSRSFGARPKLLAAGSLTRFRRSTVDALRSITREQLEQTVARWLDEDEAAALWKRRNEIVDLVQKRIDEGGESSVLY